MIFVPESPLYLVEKNDHAGATLSLMRLRGATTPIQIENELNEVSGLVKIEDEISTINCLGFLLMVF